MTQNENTIPMISGILEAVPLPETQPTLTNLDRSTWHPLLLDKLNEKLFDDQLSVSIRLGLHPNFISELYPEKAQLEAWKRVHLYERLFDVEFGGREAQQHNSNGNKITLNEEDQDHAYSVNVDWNRNKELPLRIRFNCVSSQFRNSPVFVLVVRVASKIHKYELFHSFCQINLTWPGLAVEQNSMNGGIEDDTESQSSEFELNIIGQTRLIPYDPIKLLRQEQYRPNDNANERLFDYLQQSQANFETIANESANQNYLQYSFEGPEDAYLETNRDNLQQFKGIFIQPDASFGIKIRPDGRMKNQFNPEQVAVIRCELQKPNQPFSQKDLTDWLNQNPGKTMIEPDYGSSRFTSNLLDVRMISVNQIELILKSNLETEEIAAFKVNSLSKDFSVKNQVEMPFNLIIKSIQPTTRINLGSSSFKTFTSNEDTSEQMITKFLNQSTLEQEPSIPSIPSNFTSQFELSSLTVKALGFMTIVLLLLVGIQFYDSAKGAGKLDQIVQAKLEAGLKDFSKTVETMIQARFDSLSKVRADSNSDWMFDETISETESDDPLQIILSAPTVAGITQGYPTLTNLDRSVWYNLQLKKLDPTLHQLLVSFRLGLDSDAQLTDYENYENLLKQWKTLHPSERLFDLEYMTNEIEPQNNVTVNDIVDSVGFNWNALNVANLRIRFNVVNCQFPFKRSQKSANNSTFYLHVKVSSLNKSSETVIDDSFSQVKLFWPNGAAVANQKANKLTLQSKSENLAPSRPYTKFSFSNDDETLVKQSQNKFEKDDSFLERLSTLEKSKLTEIPTNTQNYLDYILVNPVMSFVNVLTKEGEQFKGFFVDESGLFAIKLLTNPKVSSEVAGSIVRTRFELRLPNSRAFSEQELTNWSNGPLFEVNYLQSQLSDMVYDIRQVSVNCIELLWLPKLDQLLRDLVIAFNLNSDHGTPLLLQVQTIMIKNETGLTVALDSASSQIVVTEIDQAQAIKRNWLQQNVDQNAQYSTETSILNDPIGEQSSQTSKFPNISLNFKLPTLTFPDNATSFIIFIILWVFRVVFFRMIAAYSLNAYRGKLASKSANQNVIGAIFIAVIGILIYASFKLNL